MARMHADEIETDVHLVRELLSGQFPHWAGLPIRPVPSWGADNAVYRLGDDLSVRLPRVRSAADAVDREHEWVPRLAPQLDVAISVPVARGRPAAGYPWPWSVHSWLPGVNPSVDALTDPEGLARDLAAFIAALWRLDPTGAPEADRGRPLIRRDAVTRAAIAELDGVVDAAAATAVWEEALGVETWTWTPLWVHGDLSPLNLLVRNGRLTGVIDFSDLGVGDPACDLIIAWSLLSDSARDTFRATLGVDDATWTRGRASALSWALEVLPYYRDTNPGLMAVARHVLQEVLS